MRTIKTVLFTIMLALTTCFWVLLSAEGFANYIGDINFLHVVSYIITIFVFFGMWIVIGTRYLNINLEG